jgi:hypothetical protein
MSLIVPLLKRITWYQRKTGVNATVITRMRTALKTGYLLLSLPMIAYVSLWWAADYKIIHP